MEAVGPLWWLRVTPTESENAIGPGSGHRRPFLAILPLGRGGKHLVRMGVGVSPTGMQLEITGGLGKGHQWAIWAGSWRPQAYFMLHTPIVHGPTTMFGSMGGEPRGVGQKLSVIQMVTATRLLQCTLTCTHGGLCKALYVPCRAFSPF